MPRKVKAASRTEHFNNNLKYYREKAGLSQQQLADKVGVGRTYISECELGISRLTLKMAKKYAEVLNVSPYELLGMDAIKYTGNFPDILQALVYANFDNMINGTLAKTISTVDFNIYMIIWELINHEVSEDDIIALHNMVKMFTDKLPERKYRDD